MGGDGGGQVSIGGGERPDGGGSPPIPPHVGKPCMEEVIFLNSLRTGTRIGPGGRD